jgi:uncharacterized protein YgiM (DUF1202 family)
MRGWRRAWPLLLIVIATIVWAATQMQSVQVRTGQLRERPSFLGKVTAEVSYGDRMTILESRGAWTKVRNAGGGEGWIHTSALTEKKVVLRSGDADAATTASGEELALAGKGFNDEVEARYREENPDVDYTWVDRMEKIVVDARQAGDFLTAGGVQPREGGAR